MALLRPLTGLCILVLLTSCLSEEDNIPPSRQVEAASKPTVEKAPASKPAATTTASPKIRTSGLSSGEVARLSDASRPHLPFFGAMIYADQIDFLNGTATGDVFIDGSAMNSANQEWPKYVRADKVIVDLANEKVTLSGFPRMEWSQAHLRATSASTTIYLSRSKYKVEGPAQYGLAF